MEFGHAKLETRKLHVRECRISLHRDLRGRTLGLILAVSLGMALGLE